MICSERAGAHAHQNALQSRWLNNVVLANAARLGALLKSFPRGILIHPVEDLCLGLLLASWFRPGSFFYSHYSSRRRLCLFLSALQLPLPAKSQRAIWKSPLASTLRPIFPSSSSTAKSMVLSWHLYLAPTELNTPPSSRLKNSSTWWIPLKSPAPLFLSPSSTFNPSNKKFPMSTLSTTRA